MIIYLKDYSELEGLVEKYKPTVLVFGGKHEPAEPSARVLETIIDGKPLHEHFKPSDMLFVVHPKSATPAEFWKDTYKKLLTLAEDMIAGKPIDYNFNGNNVKVTGKRIKRYLQIPDMFDGNKDMIAALLADEDAQLVLKQMMTKKDSAVAYINAQLKSGDMNDWVSLPGFFLTLCNLPPGYIKDYVKEKMVIPPKESVLNKRLNEMAPWMEVVFVHHTPIPEDKAHISGNVEEKESDGSYSIELYREYRSIVPTELKNPFFAARLSNDIEQMQMQYVSEIDPKDAEKVIRETVGKLKKGLEKILAKKKVKV